MTTVLDVMERAEGPYTLEVTNLHGTITKGFFDDWRVAVNADKGPDQVKEWCIRTASGIRVYPRRTVCDVLQLCEGPYTLEGWAPGWQDIAIFPNPEDAMLEATIGYPDDDTRIVTASGHEFWRSPPGRSDSAP